MGAREVVHEATKRGILDADSACIRLARAVAAGEAAAAATGATDTQITVRLEDVRDVMVALGGAAHLLDGIREEDVLIKPNPEKPMQGIIFAARLGQLIDRMRTIAGDA